MDTTLSTRQGELIALARRLDRDRFAYRAESAIPTNHTRNDIQATIVVRVLALGGSFVTLAFYHRLYGSLLLIIYALVVSLVIPEEHS
jgi:hypothetical protein